MSEFYGSTTKDEAIRTIHHGLELGIDFFDTTDMLHQGWDVIPIPGTTSTKHLEDNAQAVEVELAEAELERLDGIGPPGVTTGQWYADMRTVNR